MNKIFFLISVLFSSVTYASSSIELTSEEAERLGFKFKPWDSWHKLDIEDFKKSSDCVYFEIEFPQHLTEHPKAKYIIISGRISRNNKLITQLDFPIMYSGDNKKYTHACLPLSNEFDVGIAFTFSDGSGGLCQTKYRYVINNVRNYLKDAGLYSEL